MIENLFKIFQNTAVSAMTLHSFTLGYNSVMKHKDNEIKFPHLNYMFFVLPIVYNYKSMETFKSSRELYSALLKDTSIILGLQDRACKMSEETFNALNIAFSKKILGLNKENFTIEPLRNYQSKKIPLPLSMNTQYNTVKSIQDCGFKLGCIFAKRDETAIQFELNIKF